MQERHLRRGLWLATLQRVKVLGQMVPRQKAKGEKGEVTKTRVRFRSSDLLYRSDLLRNDFIKCIRTANYPIPRNEQNIMANKGEYLGYKKTTMNKSRTGW